MKEIGSEFSMPNLSLKPIENSVYEMISSLGNDRKFLFSGRTAIDYILQDIESNLDSVYMPSYCCDSMLQPFVDRGIEIVFYSVFFEQGEVKYEIDYTKQVDLFFGMSYFGFQCSNMDEIMRAFRMKKVLVIEDITHRLFSKFSHCEAADYLVASIRKWLPIATGGVAMKIEKTFKDYKLNEPSKELIEKKSKAMKLKKEYLASENIEEIVKKQYLNLFAEFNRGLNSKYKNIAIDFLSESILKCIDVSELRKTRVQNAKYIYENLKDSNTIELMFKVLNLETDCPLFVPIKVDNKVRHKLKSFLIANSIYCPVHWPISNMVDSNSVNINIYEQEFSLICDQRYEILDMEYQLNKIGEFESRL